MNKISWKVANWLCQWEECKEFSEEIQFAIYQLLWDVNTLLLALLSVYLMYRDIQAGIVFSIFFLPLRQTAGGAHAQSHCKCLILTILMFMTCAYYYYGNTLQSLMLMAIIAWVIIWMKAPAQTKNHVLTIPQAKRNRDNTRKILLLYMVIVIVYFPINTRIVNSVLLVLIMAAMLILIESCDLKIPACQLRSGMQTYIAQAILGICIFTCHNAVSMTSYRWNYQENVPNTLRRKYDDM